MIKIDDVKTSEWLQGESQNDGILGENNFWDQANDLMERMMYTGTCAIVLRLKNARVNDKGQITQNSDAKINMNFVSAEKIIPLTIDNGIITEAAFCSDISRQGKKFIYLEIHRIEGNEYVIENHMFSVDKSEKSSLIEQPLPLPIPQIIHTASDIPWFAVCKPAVVNTLDNNNGLGCAVFANAIDNLKGVDLVYNNFNSDFWLGQKKVFLNKNMLAEMSGENKITPDEVNQQLFCFIGETMDDGSGRTMIQEHNPDLRVDANTAGLQAQLDYLSFKCGLGLKHYQFNGGTIVTATQYTGDKQDLIQNAHKHFIKIETFLHQLTKTVLGIGNKFIDPKIKVDAKIDIIFDQSPFIDENIERQRDKEDVRDGLMLDYEYRQKWYGESEETAKSKLAEKLSDDEYMGFADNEDGDE